MLALLAAMLSSCKEDDIPVFSVTFDSRGGTPIATQIVKQGGKVNKPIDPTLPEHYFAGWTVTDNETSLHWDFEKGTVTYNIRLYARWAQNRHTVTVSNDEDGTASANVTLGVVGELVTLTATARSGYRFAEWQVIEGGIALSSTTDNPATFIMPDEAVEVKALFLPFNTAPLKIWQTFSAFPDGIHEWDEIESEYLITRLPDLPMMRSGFGFTDGRNLILADVANRNNRFLYTNNYTDLEYSNSPFLHYLSLTHEFSEENGWLYARLLVDRRVFKRIQISGHTIFAYAQYKNDVIAATNWGEVLIFRDNEWYRMTQVRPDIYLITPGASIQTEPSRKQFYCSIIYQGRTLLGEYPSGKIFEFVGDVLQVSDISPPEELLVVESGFDGQLKEAQSMAIYGGDLFVGYWPDGVILRYDYKQESWSQFTRLFDFPSDGKNIHEYTSPPSNFYGQRIQALVPFEDGLYVVTSNLGEWYEDVIPSPFLTEEQIKQYGAVYKIYRPGCRTTYFPR